jgi:hypothetical protein
MIKLSGLSEDEIKIVFSGLRPGEKLYEELLAEEEKTLSTPHKKLRIAHSEGVDKKWLNALLIWIGSIPEKDEILVKKELKSWVKGFNSSIKKD